MPYRIGKRSTYIVKGAVLLGAILMVIALGAAVASNFASEHGQTVFLACKWTGTKADCRVAYSG
jgi:hypothetical protein